MKHKGNHQPQLVTINGVCFCISCIAGSSSLKPKIVVLSYKFCSNCGIALPLVVSQYCHLCEAKL